MGKAPQWHLLINSNPEALKKYSPDDIVDVKFNQYGNSTFLLSDDSLFEFRCKGQTKWQCTAKLKSSTTAYDGGGAEVLGLCSIYDVEVPAPEAPEFTVTFVDGSNDAVISSMTVEAGTVLDPADFPEAPAHEGLEFTGWDYNNAPIYADTTITAQYFDPDAPVPTGWYFESDPAADGWTWIDQDGDGNNWQWVYDAGLTVYEGLGMMNSQSYINYVGALTPDNWLVTPTFVGGGSISFYMAGQDPAYAAEPIGVYVSMDGGATWGEIGLPMTILTFLCLPLIISDGSMNIPMLNLMRSALNIESIT